MEPRRLRRLTLLVVLLDSLLGLGIALRWAAMSADHQALAMRQQAHELLHAAMLEQHRAGELD